MPVTIRAWRIALSGAALAALALAGPANAGWEDVAWGMNLDQVVAAGGPATARIKEDKGMRIMGMHRLATGKAIIDGMAFDLHYYFDPKSLKLKAINFIPPAKECDAAIAAYLGRFGRPTEKRKEMPLRPDEPPLVQVEYEWKGGPTLGGDKIEGVDVSVAKTETRYCQFLRSG